MHKEVNAKSFDNNINGNSPQKTFKISVSGSPNSCLVKIGKQRYRTLVDTGAECSLMHRRIYDQLKNKPRLINKKVCLQSANGTELKCDGCITVQICIGGTEMSQDFYVIRYLNRNLILGSDWLKQNNVRIYFCLKCLRINGKHYVNLEDIHIASTGGARWLSGRVSDSGARGPGFETYRRRVVSLSKTLYSPKVLVNYPGSDGFVPT